MPEHIRSLIVILFIATFVFFYAKKALGPLLLPNEFNRWRTTWFAITLIAFLSSNFWLFIILTLVFLLYKAKSEQNIFALYFALLITIPTITSRIPGLVDFNYVRVLALALLLPFFISFKTSSDVPSFGKSTAEKLMFAYLIFSLILQLRGTSFTDMLRSGFNDFTDIFLPYFAASRAIKNLEQLKKVMIALVLACLLAGAIGAFEFKSSWLLYNALQNALNVDWDMGRYLGRGDSLRALASLGHPIILGFIMMVGFGFYLFIAPFIKHKILRFTGLGLILVGLISSLSRGPWVGVGVLILIFIMLGKNVFRNFAILFLAILISAQALHWIPGGNKVINLIPFIGETEKDNIEYRQDLIDNSILIIERYPLLGVYDPKKEPEMEEMVQGEGIIDLVNTYLVIALYNGLVTLSLFLAFYFLVLLAAYKKIRKISDKESEEYLCGRSLLATLVAVLVAIFTVSSIGVIPTVYWSLAGLIISYVRMSKTTETIKFDRTDYPTTRLKSNQ